MNSRTIIHIVLSVIGAALGSVLGYFAHRWILSQHLNALVLPGALLGFGSALFSWRRTVVRGLLCALAAIGLGIYCEWSHAPFIADGSLAYFITHLYQIPVIPIMILVGSLMAFWLGQGDISAMWRQQRPPSVDLEPPANP